MSRVPLPLAALLAVVLLFGVTWALAVPPFQVPDEAHHIAYTQSIVERGELPGDGPNLLSTEESVTFDAALHGNLLGDTFKRPEWSARVDRRLRGVEGRLPADDGGGPIAQGDNPPLYYLYEALPYLAGSGASFLARVHLMRLWSVLLLLVTTTAGWLLAGEVFGRDRLLQLVAASLVGLQPMVTFVSAGVNPDAALFALWTVALWLGARVVRRGLTVRDGVALGLVAGFAVTEKATSWALVPAVLLAMAVGWRRLAPDGRRPRRPVALALLALALPAGAWIATAAALGRSVTNHAPHVAGVSSPSLTSLHSLREFASYVWQYYLPRLPFQSPYPGLEAGGSHFYTTWHETGWGAFGLLDVRLPDWTYSLLAIASALAILGGVAALVRADRRRRVDPALVGFFLLAGAALMFTLHWVDYTFLTLEHHAVEQGRYVLPLVAIGGLALAGAVSLLPPRARPPAAGALLALLVVLQVGSLGVTLERFYA